jgi:hypothetical protein
MINKSEQEKNFCYVLPGGVIAAGSGERREIWGGENLERKEDTVYSFNSR